MSSIRDARGMPKTRRLAWLKTFPIDQLMEKGFEGGYYELSVDINLVQLSASGDPRQFFFHTIAVMLRSAVEDTTIPKEMWFVEFTPKAQRMFELPQAMPFDPKVGA